MRLISAFTAQQPDGAPGTLVVQLETGNAVELREAKRTSLEWLLAPLGGHEQHLGYTKAY